MKPGDNLNNLSQLPRGAPLDSTTENNSFSSDSDTEVVGGDQKRIIQGLKRTIKRNQTKINDLTAKLTITENNLASEKEKTKDKEDVIKSLKLSIDLNTQIKDLKLTTLQSQLIELQTALDSSKIRNVTQDNSSQNLREIGSGQYNTKIEELNADIEILESKLRNRNNKLSELDDKTKKYESDLQEKDEHIAKLEYQTKLYLETTQKYESDLRKKDEHIAKLESQMEMDAAKIEEMEDKLSKFTLKAETSQDSRDSFVLLNCTKIPSVQFVTLPKQSFAAVFEDLPSAGPGWMVIQRRIDGSVPFHTRRYDDDYYNGFGDLSREFWLGCKKLHELTTSRRHELYIELVDFDNATAFARYDNFVVGSANKSYGMNSLGDYSGNAGDFLRECEEWRFNAEAYDNHEKRDSYGWWNNAQCNLNGKYYDHKTEIQDDWYTNQGIWWGRWNMGKKHALKSCKMLIRPKP